MDQNKLIVAVDFDGTLCIGNYPGAGRENWGLIHALQELRIEGKIYLILWTCRNGSDLEFAVKWCKERGLIFDAVNENLPWVVQKYGGDTRKVSADIYIDDFAESYNSITDYGIGSVQWIRNRIMEKKPYHGEKEK